MHMAGLPPAAASISYTLRDDTRMNVQITRKCMTKTTFDGLSACTQVLLCPCYFGTSGARVRLAGPAVSWVHRLPPPPGVTRKGRSLN